MLKKWIFAIGLTALGVLACVLILQEQPVKTDLLNGPKTYFQTDRIIHTAILSQKKTGVAELDRKDLERATLSLFTKLKADQKYTRIIAIYDPSYPKTDPDLFASQARHDFPDSQYLAIYPDSSTTETDLSKQLPQDNQTLYLLHSYLNYTDTHEDLTAFQKAHYKNVFDHPSKAAWLNLPYTNTAGLKAIYQLSKNLNSLKALPTLEDSTYQYQIKFLTDGSGQPTQITHLVFLGDMMLGRQVRQLMDATSLDYPFQKLDLSFLKSNDLLIGNLEGPIAENAVRTSKAIAFRFLPDIAPLLAKYSFDALSQANNHAYDMGTAGFSDTTRYLHENNIIAFGDARRLSDQSASLLDQHGQKIALLGLNHTDFKLDLDATTKRITELKGQGYKVIPFIHWGAEYQHQPTTEQIKLAHAFVDAGAFAVIGMHPHVVESLEIYNNAPIFYSLGNVIFDQNFSQDTQEGLTLAMEISPEKLSILLLPIKIERSQPRLMTPDERTDFLVNKLATWWRYDDQEIKAQIEKGKIVINLVKN